MMPTLADDGLTLVHHNAGIKCESNQPTFVSAKGEVSELEGFFCLISYIDGQSAKQK